MRTVLALVALIAMLMVPISTYYRALLNRSDVFAKATLMIGAQGTDSSKYVAQLNSNSFRQLVLDEPQIQGVKLLSNSPDPHNWLIHHLSIRPVGNTHLIEVMAHGQSKRLSSRDLRALVETTIELIRSDARKTNTPVTVVATTNIKR